MNEEIFKKILSIVGHRKIVRRDVIGININGEEIEENTKKGINLWIGQDLEKIEETIEKFSSKKKYHQIFIVIENPDIEKVYELIMNNIKKWKNIVIVCIIENEIKMISIEMIKRYENKEKVLKTLLSLDKEDKR